MGFGFGKASDYMNAKFGRSGIPDLEVDLPGGSQSDWNVDGERKNEFFRNNWNS